MIYAASLDPSYDLPGIGYGTRRVLLYQLPGEHGWHVFCPYKLIQSPVSRLLWDRWKLRTYQLSSHKARQVLRVLNKRHRRWERIGRTHISPAVMRDVTQLLQERIDARTPRNFARNATLPPPSWFKN